MDKYVVETIPVPAKVPKNIAQVVDQILAAKDADPASDSSALEAEIDRLVYDLYGLTEDEVAAVERRLSPIRAEEVD